MAGTGLQSVSGHLQEVIILHNINEMGQIQIKRIYEPTSDDDGYRVLVDRLWPRGISKDDAKLDEWNRDIAPSNELRKWFGHEDEKFSEFESKYLQELKDKKKMLEELRERAEKGTVSLLYGAKNREKNQAVVLRKLLLNQLEI